MVRPADDTPPPELNLRNVPSQARSRKRLGRLLDAADELLAQHGALALTAARVAERAGVSVGSFYHYFPEKDAIVDALAVRYWSDFEDLVAGLAEANERDPLQNAAGAIIEVLAAGFRARPGFQALWFGGLRSERVRDATRPTRTAIARSVRDILDSLHPGSDPTALAVTANMAVLVGDGLLREAFRLSPDGEATVLAEATLVLEAYIEARLH